MRELKLKYFIDLVSNVGTKARTDAKLMQDAQAVMNAAITGTNNKFLDYNKLSALAGKNTAMMQEVITGATNRFTALDRAISQLGHNTSTERQIGYLQRLASAIDQANSRAQRLRDSLAHGLGKAPEAFAAAAGGYYGARSIVAPPIRASSSLEAATQDLRIAMTDSKGQVSGDFGRISAEASKLGNQLPGTTKDFMLAARALKTQGVPSSVVANGGLRASSYVGALLELDQSRAAEVIAKLREAHGLEDNELVPMADLMQRAFFGFGIKPQDFMESSKYSATTLNTMKITGLEKTREQAAIMGMAANVGLENTSFGTNYSQMLTRLSQIEPRLAKKSKEAKHAKETLAEHGISMSFYGEDGEFKGNLNMLQQLAKLRRLNPLEQTRMIHSLFGVEGGRPAQIMVQKGLEGYEAARRTLDDQANLDTRLAMKMETFASKLEALSGTIENVMAKIATHTTDSLKPGIDKATDVLGGPVSNFFDQHPAAGTALLGGAAGIGTWLTGRLGFSVAKRLLGRGAAAAAPAAASALLKLAPEAVGYGAGASAMIGNAARLSGYGTLAWGGWELGNWLGDKYVDSVKNREGVVLSPDSRARLSGSWQDQATARAVGMPLGLGGGPAPPDWLTLTAPGVAPINMPAGRQTELKVGEGRLDVNVTVHDDRVSATSSVGKPLSLVRLSTGNTNPAGY